MAIEDIIRISEKLNNSESLDKSLKDTHIKKLFSLVFHGKENGELTRAFFAGKKIRPYDAQLHTHTYDLKITAIKGKITHHLADLGKSNGISLYRYKSPLNGGKGLEYSKDIKVDLLEYTIPLGSSVWLRHDEIHTVSCSKDSIWVVEELGFKVDTSFVLGNAFVTDGLYNKPDQFQVNDSFQLLRNELKKIILNHNLTT